jgi:hypothetical protein
MKTVLHVADPSVEWRAFQQMIKHKPELRDDVTLVVEPDRLRVLDQENREIATGLPAGNWTSSLDLDTTMSLLTWLDVRFARAAR